MKSAFVEKPSEIHAAGIPPKRIEEFFGRVNTGTADVSIARMTSPAGWKEPAQAPEFDEYTVVFKGALHVKLRDKEIIVRAGQAVMVGAGERVRYSTPEGAEYIAVCLPAFSPDTAHRDPG